MNNAAPKQVPDNSLYWGAIQMLEHWKRCGCDQIPAGNEQVSQEWPQATTVAKSSVPESGSLPVKPGLIRTEPMALATGDRANKSVPLAPEASVFGSGQADFSSGPVKPPLPSIPLHGQPSRSLSQKSVAQSTSAEPSRWITETQSPEQRGSRLEVLQTDVASCKRCPELACSRKQTVFGGGALNPRVVFFGEAPGADEDRLGQPFVGAAGQLLNKILVASQIKREETYILNSLKCRPPANRTPSDLEIENCRPYFEAQLELLQPEFIVCLGAVAVRAVLKSTEPVGRLRGRFHRFRGAQVLVTYHPAYLLRNEDAKRLTWSDMQLLMNAMGLKLPGK